MYAVCACTCVRSSITSRRLFSISSKSLLKGVDSPSTTSSSTSSRLEWDSQNKQWKKKQQSAELKTTPSSSNIRRPTPAERQAILQQLKEQRLNEVTELDASVKPEETVTATKETEQEDKPDSNESNEASSSSSSSSSSTATAKNESSSGRRYMRGQDSSSLNVSSNGYL